MIIKRLPYAEHGDGYYLSDLNPHNNMMAEHYYNLKN